MRKAALCRSAQNKIDFAIEGAGKIIGVGNGDPTCHEPDTFRARPGAPSRSATGGGNSKLTPPPKVSLHSSLALEELTIRHGMSPSQARCR